MELNRARNFDVLFNHFLPIKGMAGQEIILQENNKLVTNQSEVAKTLNDFYINVVSDLGPSDNLPSEVDHMDIQEYQNKDHHSVQKIKEKK